MAVASDSPSAEDVELDERALTQFLTVLEDVGRVRHADDMFLVVSQSGSEYLVDSQLPACECADFRYRNRTCKHIRRVQFATGAREIPEWIDPESVDDQLGLHIDSGGSA